MKNKTVHIISDSISLKINKEIANFNIINILLNENKSLSDVIIEVSKKLVKQKTAPAEASARKNRKLKAFIGNG